MNGKLYSDVDKYDSQLSNYPDPVFKQTEESELPDLLNHGNNLVNSVNHF